PPRWCRASPTSMRPTPTSTRPSAAQRPHSSPRTPCASTCVTCRDPVTEARHPGPGQTGEETVLLVCGGAGAQGATGTEPMEVELDGGRNERGRRPGKHIPGRIPGCCAGGCQS